MEKELVFLNHENGLKVAKMLLDEGYVVMLSYEEELLVLNFIWSANNADRNDIVFMDEWEFDSKYVPICDENNICEQVRARMPEFCDKITGGRTYTYDLLAQQEEHLTLNLLGAL